MKKVLIVEDEPLALEDLRDSLLQVIPSLEITAAQTASEAIEILSKNSFDAVFLDIELPGMNGIDMLQRLKPPLPPVVLVTAHALHALDAFGLGVIECLLKPVDQERLKRALAKIALMETQPTTKASGLDGDEMIDRDSRILIREGDRIWMVKVMNISRLQESNEGVRIFFSIGSGLVGLSLMELDARLDRRYFFRIDDRYIVNLDAVERFTTSPAGRFVAHFADGLSLEFSAEQSRTFEQRHRL